MTFVNTGLELYCLNSGKIADNQYISIISKGKYSVGKHQSTKYTNLKQTQNRQPGHLKNINPLIST